MESKTGSNPIGLTMLHIHAIASSQLRPIACFPFCAKTNILAIFLVIESFCWRDIDIECSGKLLPPIRSTCAEYRDYLVSKAFVKDSFGLKIAFQQIFTH